MTTLTATGGGWDTGSGSLTIGTGTSDTTVVGGWWPDTTYHYHWNGCGCGVHVVGRSTHQHDYQQAQGSAYEDTLFCRTCGDTKRLKPRKAKEV